MQEKSDLPGVKKSPNPMPGASNFHIWASCNNQLFARLAIKKIYRILTNLSIFAYLLVFIYVICCLISSNVLFIQPLAFCWNWEQRTKKVEKLGISHKTASKQMTAYRKFRKWNIGFRNRERLFPVCPKGDLLLQV